MHESMNAGVRSRWWGLYGLWGGLLRQLLEQLLPGDAAERCNSGRAAVLTTAFPWLYNVTFSEYDSRSDVIQAVLASAHIPLLMDRQWSASLVGGCAAASASAAAAAASAAGGGGARGEGSSGSSRSGQAPLAAAAAAAAVAAVGPAAPAAWMRTPLAIDGNFWYMVGLGR